MHGYYCLRPRKESISPPTQAIKKPSRSNKEFLMFLWMARGFNHGEHGEHGERPKPEPLTTETRRKDERDSKEALGVVFAERFS
jgi:hypothetical protein